jgi:solute carrier family 25 aspartate/glutamate transporter 12/13
MRRLVHWVYCGWAGADEQWEPPIQAAAADLPAPATALSEIGESVWNFTIGGIAGAIGAFVVFPIDLVSNKDVLPSTR